MSDTEGPGLPVEPDELVPLDRPSTGRPGRRRTALVVLPLLAGLAAAGGVGGQLLLGAAEDPTAADSLLTCWDGAQVEVVSACTKPRGVDGLAWVFPSFDRESQDCVDELVAHPEYTRPAMWTCQQAVGGRPVSITYSEVSTQRAALRFFDALHGVDERRAGRSQDGASEIYAWTPTETSEGRWEASLLLRDAPFAVTVSASLRSDASRTLTRRVEVRPPDERRTS